MNQIMSHLLDSAFVDNRMATIRYREFAKYAKLENFINVARLYQAVSHAKNIQAGEHYRNIRYLCNIEVPQKLKDGINPNATFKYLELTLNEKNFGIKDLYPSFIQIAEMNNELEIKQYFEWAYQSEIQHKALFEKAKSAVENNQDIELNEIHVCGACGYTIEQNLPEVCPVCNANNSVFKTF